MNARKILALLAILAPAICASAQLNTSRAEEQEVQRLLALPDLTMRFQSAPLDDVLRTLCEASDMAFIGLPKPKDAPNVDMTIKGNPYQALLLVAQTYGYVPLYENGLWHFSPLKEERAKLFPKIYKLKDIQISSVDVNQKSMDAAASRDTSSALPSPVNSQAFTSEASKVIEDIKVLLELDPANFALTEKEATAPQNPASLLLSGVPANQLVDKAGMPKEQKQENLKGRIIADPDQNALFIIASKEHHQWIETYLNAIDVPQKLVLLETRFVRLQNDPTNSLGIDWSALKGYDIAITNKATTSDTSGGLNASFNGAILTSGELDSALNFLSTNTESRIMQHPSQVTVNNRQVVLRNVTQYPFVSGSATNTTSGTSSTTSEVQYIPIGTTVSLLPRILDGNNIEMCIMINVSDMIEDKYVVSTDSTGTHTAPETASRDYSGQAILASGNTLAIGGLDLINNTDSSTKVPVLGSIPLFGKLFSNQTKTVEDDHIVIFITASILDGYSGKDGVRYVSDADKIIKELDAALASKPDDEKAMNDKANSHVTSKKQYLLK